ncbi:Flagellin [Achromobacter animicus]|uniref:Flagellin n=1 Tax=Achromobacter animicus TaxID=1389935 RepID=A0A6S7AKI0_9BURK|nr:FliC/FljB family flagellin [Achromobacter animicus]CAB3736465.1 Flagellin [Achromobacter animicus]
MAAVINTNYLSLVAQNNLNKSQSSLGTAIERLSSGLRINSAKDDAAGMAIANRFTANVKGLTQAARNANDGISLAQTTEGAASEVNTHLQRIRELTVQASNGSYSQEQLDSVQGEINQRMADIDRISQQTDFNGVKVLSDSAKPLTLQVGANDGETITLNLSEISVKTLGLDGFNVNGKGVTQNRTATVTDISAAKGTETAAGSGVYNVITKHDAVTSAQVFDKLANGDKVTTDTAGTPTVYTYDAEKGNFTFTNKTGAVGNTVADLAAKQIPTSGTVTGTFTNATKSASFEVDSTGKVTLNGEQAYLSAAGELTTNNGTGSNVATMANMFAAVAQGSGAANTYKYAGASITVGETKYTQAGGTFAAAANGELQFTDVATKDTVLNKSMTGNTTVDMGSGIFAAAVTLVNGASAGANATYVDGNGSFTKVDQYTTEYTVNKDTGEVKVSGGNGPGEYAPKIGSTAYVNSKGELTTKTESAGDKTTDPLKTLDAAFTKLDKLTGELGAVQNRLESTIANLNNVVNNLSSARSRIQDADYATEVSNMSKAQILQQAGTSVLAQANQVPQTVLSLLR